MLISIIYIRLCLQLSTITVFISTSDFPSSSIIYMSQKTLTPELPSSIGHRMNVSLKIGLIQSSVLVEFSKDRIRKSEKIPPNPWDLRCRNQTSLSKYFTQQRSWFSNSEFISDLLIKFHRIILFLP